MSDGQNQGIVVDELLADHLLRDGPNDDILETLVGVLPEFSFELLNERYDLEDAFLLLLCTESLIELLAFG